MATNWNTVVQSNTSNAERHPSLKRSEREGEKAWKKCPVKGVTFLGKFPPIR